MHSSTPSTCQYTQPIQYTDHLTHRFSYLPQSSHQWINRLSLFRQQIWSATLVSCLIFPWLFVMDLMPVTEHTAFNTGLGNMRKAPLFVFSSYLWLESISAFIYSYALTAVFCKSVHLQNHLLSFSSNNVQVLLQMCYRKQRSHWSQVWNVKKAI